MPNDQMPDWGAIRVRGARENNLQNISLDIPKRTADRVHRRFRLGQELARVRDDRRGVAAADQRDLQRLRAGLHADAGPARRRLARRPDDRDHPRPGADGRQRPFHRRHGDGRERDAAGRLQPSREAAHRRTPGVLLQRPVGHGRRGDQGRSRLGGDREPKLQRRRRHVPAVRGHGQRERHRPDAALRRDQVACGRCDHCPRLHRGRLVDADVQRVRLLRRRTSRSATSPRRSSTTSSTRSPSRSGSTAST